MDETGNSILIGRQEVSEWSVLSYHLGYAIPAKVGRKFYFILKIAGFFLFKIGCLDGSRMKLNSTEDSSSNSSSVAQSCLTLCDPMNRNMPGLSVHHQLPEFTQTHVHRVGDAIQPSHPLSSPSPPVPSPPSPILTQWRFWCDCLSVTLNSSKKQKAAVSKCLKCISIVSNDTF